MKSRTADRREIELDVRAIPPRDRHAKIFSLLDALEPGCELTITTDHEPRPLRVQLDERSGGQYVWLQRMLAGDLWRVTLRRIGSSAQEGVAGFLRRCALLADASDDTHARLAASANERVLARGQAVVGEAAHWSAFGLVREGTLSAILTSRYGREHALYEVLPTEPFGEVSALDGGAALARFEVTSSRADLITFRKPAFSAAMAADAPLVRALATIAAQRMRTVVERFAAQTSLPTTARVAIVLLPHAGPEPGLRPALSTLRGMTQAQIATAAGTVKVVVSRALSDLERAGAIERRAGRIARVDREKLTRFAR